MDSVQRRLAYRERWQSVTLIPLLLASAGFIVTYSLLVLLPDVSTEIFGLFFLILAAIWLVFLVDYVVRLAITPRHHRWQFVRSNVIDLLSVFLPLFRSFRLVALFGRIPYFQGRSGTAVRSRVVIFAASYAVLFVYFVALATLQAEREATNATIVSFGDAVWWACVTLFTVGYGDTYPVTVPGRMWAVALMAGGIVIIGTTSALVVSYLTERMSHRRDQRRDPGHE